MRSGTCLLLWWLLRAESLPTLSLGLGVSVDCSELGLALLKGLLLDDLAVGVCMYVCMYAYLYQDHARDLGG